MANVLKLSSFLVILFLSCNEPSKHKETITHGHLNIDNKTQSFGNVNKREIKEVKCYFSLSNTGDSTIIINKIDVSCGCISTDISSNSILPNEHQLLTVTINTSNRLGVFNKSVFIQSNADNSVEIIRIKGTIIE